MEQRYRVKRDRSVKEKIAACLRWAGRCYFEKTEQSGSNLEPKMAI